MTNENKADIETFLQIGKKRFPVTVPAGWRIVPAPNHPTLQVDRVAEQAFPDAERMRDIIGGRSQAIIVVDDDHTPSRVQLVVPSVAKCLIDAGIRPSKIKIFLGHAKGERIIGRDLIAVVGEKNCGQFDTVMNGEAGEYDDHGRNTMLLAPDTIIVVMMPVLDGVDMDFDRHPLRAIAPGALSPDSISEFYNTRFSKRDIVTESIRLWLDNLPDAVDEKPPAAFIGVAVKQDALGRLAGVEFVEDIPAYLMGSPRDVPDAVTDGDTSAAPAMAAPHLRAVITACGGRPADAYWDHIMRTLFDAAGFVEDGGILALAASGDGGIACDAWLDTLKAIVEGGITDVHGMDPESRVFAAKLTMELKRIRLRFFGPGFVSEDDDDDDEIRRRTLPSGNAFRALPMSDEAWRELRAEIESVAPDGRVSVCPHGPWFLAAGDQQE